MRLDELLVERGFYDTAHDARAAVIAGEIIVGEHRADYPGMQVDNTVELRCKTKKRRGAFVSRGGLKLQHALDVFDVDVTNMDCVDLGASSGGFTDCLLQHGASHVSAVDVGSGQFDWKLRNDPRISLYERTNIRNIHAQDIGGPFDVAVADLSFIGLACVMPDIASFLKPSGLFISLIKPQFEADRSDVGDGGVVRDDKVQIQCIEKVFSSAIDNGFTVCDLTFSPIKGPAGNIEFLFYAKYCGQEASINSTITETIIKDVVAQAHRELGAVT